MARLAEERARIERIHEMRTLLRERILRVHLLLLEHDPFRKEDLRVEIGALASRYMGLRAVAEAQARDPEERAMLAALRVGNREVALRVERILALDEAGRTEEARRLLLEETVPRQQEVLARGDALLDLTHRRRQAALEEIQIRFRRTLLVLGVLGATAALLTALAGRWALARSRRDRSALLDALAAHARTTAKLEELSRHLEETVKMRTRALERTATLLAEAQRIGRVGHWEWTPGEDILICSDTVCALSGLVVKGGVTRMQDFLARVHAEDRGRVEAALAQLAREGGACDLSHRVLGTDGEVRHLYQRAEAKRDPAGRVECVVASVQDVTETETLRQQLWRQAHEDALTGLPNRILLLDRLEQALARSRREGESGAVVLFDLDGFKKLNDHCGHAAGDHVLAEVGRRMRGILRETDTLGRWGGDEFVGIFPGVADAAAAAILAERIHAQFDAPLCRECAPVRIRASLGLAFYPRESQDADGLIGLADQRMYADKARRAEEAGHP